LIAAAVVLSMIAVALQVIPTIRKGRATGAVGDGKRIETYGFDLSRSLIPIDQIVTVGLAKGAVSALDRPPLLTPAGADSINHAERGKYLVPTDRVVGVTVAGAARAYPLIVLAWHEVANDTLGGIPIVVTYCPLGDAVVVFDRRIGGRVPTFGVSGLLYNSTTLVYDVQPGGQAETLWSPLLARGVVGPGAGERLEVLPAHLTTWATWRRLYPETTVLDRDPSRIRHYKKKPYGSYFGSDLLRFPVDPLPPEDGTALKTRIVGVQGDDGNWTAVSYPEIAVQVDGGGIWRTDRFGTPLRLFYGDDPPTVRIEADRPDALPPVIYAFHFAWYAMNPDTPLP